MSRTRRKQRVLRQQSRVVHPVQLQLREIFIVMIVVGAAAAVTSRWTSTWPQTQQLRFLVSVLCLTAAVGVLILGGLWRRYEAIRQAGDLMALISVNVESRTRVWLLILLWGCATMGGLLLVILALIISTPTTDFSVADVSFDFVLLTFGLVYFYMAIWRLPWLLVSMEIHERGLIVGPWRFVPYSSIRDYCWTIGRQEGIELHLRGEQTLRAPLPRDERPIVERILRRKLK